MKVKDLDPKVKAALEKLYDAPERRVRYHGSGFGNALTAKLVQQDLVARASSAPDGRTLDMLRLTALGEVVVENIRKTRPLS